MGLCGPDNPTVAVEDRPVTHNTSGRQTTVVVPSRALEVSRPLRFASPINLGPIR